MVEFNESAGRRRINLRGKTKGFNHDRPEMYNEILRRLAEKDKFLREEEPYPVTSVETSEFRKVSDKESIEVGNIWHRNRGYLNYNRLFSQAMGIDIGEYIKDKYIETSKPQRVLDYGCGDGSFLDQLKDLLDSYDKGKFYHLTGFTMQAEDSVLRLRAQAGRIDRLYYGMSYEFNPQYRFKDQEWSIIFDNFGPIYHSSVSELEFELRKVCTLLSLGGILCFGRRSYDEYKYPDSFKARLKRIETMLDDVNRPIFRLGDKIFYIEKRLVYKAPRTRNVTYLGEDTRKMYYIIRRVR